MSAMQAAEARFWSKVDRRGPTECWPWTAGRSSNGYGMMKWRPGLHVGAHRISWEIAHGAIPDGLCVLHRCDVRACVNPAHLFLGSHVDNVADRHAKGRSARGDRCGARLYPDRVPRGERNGNAKLTEVAVREIRSLAVGVSQRELAARFGVSQRTIGAVVRSRTWRHPTHRGYVAAGEVIGDAVNP